MNSIQASEEMKLRVRRETTRALRQRIIMYKWKCENGCKSKREAQAHHDDYTKPLEIRWLCAKCHGVLHAELRKSYQDARAEAYKVRAGPMPEAEFIELIEEIRTSGQGKVKRRTEMRFSEYVSFSGIGISEIALSIGAPKKNCENWVDLDMPVFVIFTGRGNILEVFRRETIFPGARRSTKRKVRQVRK